ncbi:hypothetical protein AAHN93_13940 [Vandammella animalimorsus]|uniref:hypothetical protein n=1 Tax=Vandammella animalimorsus TaxID=2029117 RepID=UPI0031BA1B07
MAQLLDGRAHELLHQGVIIQNANSHVDALTPSMVFKNALRNDLMGISCLDSSLTEDFLNDTSHSEIAAPNRTPVQEASSHNTSLIAASLQLLFAA